MGLKIRLGLAFSGLLMSSLFGVNMLTGIKDYVDTTGNIMVDIADGIGMLSKGIEYIEFYLDPDAKPEATASEGSPPNQPTIDPAPGVGAPAGVASGEAPPSPVPGAPTIIKAGAAEIPGTADQPAVICQKGKCYPYDPNRLKNSNINLEAKPGVILTPQSTPPASKQNRKYSNDDEDEDHQRKKNYQKKGRQQPR